MVDEIKIAKNFRNADASSFRGQNPFGLAHEESIFSLMGENKKELTDVEKLEKALQEVNDEQGVFQKGFNEIKEGLNIGTSSEKCEDVIEKYKKGEISFEEAEAEIAKYDNMQDSGLNVFANILCSVAAVAAATALTVATGGAGAPVLVAAIAAGAGAGAVTKAAVKTVDRATNDVNGDDFDGKEIARDMLSGAVTGATAAATMGSGSVATNTAGAVIKAGAKSGAITGAVAGAANYSIDCAVDGEKFDVGEFAQNAAVNATIGAVTGGAIGGATRAFGNVTSAFRGANAHSTSHELAKTIAKRSFATARFKVVNKTLKDVTAA